jgi:hypothetical protein
LFKNVFEGGRDLVRTVARRGAAVDLCQTIFVEAQGEFGAEARLYCGQCGKGDTLSLVVTDVELSDVFRLGAILTFRFDIDLPLTVKAVEIVDGQRRELNRRRQPFQICV